MKRTIIYTKKDGQDIGTQANGWLTENKMEQIVEKLDLGFFVDYVCGFDGERLSHPFHNRLNKSNTNFVDK